MAGSARPMDEITHGITMCIPSIPIRSDLLKRAIDSVLAQTYPVAAISVHIDHHKRGAAQNRNATLFTAHTPWVAFMDDDDVLYPDHLKLLVEKQIETGADVVFPWFDTDPPGGDPFPPAFETREYDPAEPHMFPITTLVRKTLAWDVGGFPVGDPVSPVCAGEDWTFWLKMRDAGAKFAHVNERTWLWDMNGQNTSGLPTRW